MGKKSKGFNTPFSDVERLRAIAEASDRARAERQARAEAAEAERARAARGDDRPSEGGDEPDDRLFADEMAGVAPLAPDPRGRRGAPSPSPTPTRRRLGDEAEAYAQLADLVDGTGPFDIADSDEYIEGLAPGIDRRLLRKLRRGDYALQGHLDLHGLVSDEARDAVDRFLSAARAAGKRCVLLIHGRGLNSKEGIPVLKERLKIWLTRGRIARAVLAFATARPADGGAGAVYVLLRK
jgi:DNA-nicking Smr family endonuclease